MVNRYFFNIRVELLSILFVLLLFNKVNGQNLILQGNISDENSSPLEFVSTYINETKKYAVTDKKGNFQILIPNQAFSLRIFYLGFKDTILFIAKDRLTQLKNDVLFLKIKLQRETFMLNEITVESKKEPFIEVNPFKAFYIVDYELVKGNYTLQLLSDNILLLLNQKDSVVHKEKLKFEADTLYRDCLNSFYAVNKDSAYQFIIGMPEFYWYKPISASYFHKVMDPCMAVIDENYFFSNYYNMRQGALFWLATKNKKRKYLKSINNTDMSDKIESLKAEIATLSGTKIKMNAKNAGDIYQAKAYMAVATPDDVGRRINGLTSQLASTMNEVYYPLKYVNDSVYIFNHLKDSIHVFDKSGKYVRGTKLFYHPDKYWASEIIVNAEGSEVYAKFENGGIVTLKQINLISGKAVKQVKLNVHSHLRKIEVKNNFAYYLFKNHNGETTSKILYKQYLVWEKVE